MTLLEMVWRHNARSEIALSGTKMMLNGMNTLELAWRLNVSSGNFWSETAESVLMLDQMFWQLQ